MQSYICWNSLLFRCYHKSSKLRSPTYHDCRVSENFKYYSKFKEWCNKQIGFGLKDDNGKVFALDKDKNEISYSMRQALVIEAMNYMLEKQKFESDKEE